MQLIDGIRDVEGLLGRIAGWLAPEGRLFVHVFAHQRFAYLYEDDGDDDWMARHFFTGGQMPADDLYRELGGPLGVVAQWRHDGRDYARTAEAWLRNMDGSEATLRPIIEAAAPRSERAVAWQRWRLFFLAVAELFAYRGGAEWGVTHHLFAPRGEGGGARLSDAGSAR